MKPQFLTAITIAVGASLLAACQPTKVLRETVQPTMVQVVSMQDSSTKVLERLAFLKRERVVILSEYSAETSFRAAKTDHALRVWELTDNKNLARYKILMSATDQTPLLGQGELAQSIARTYTAEFTKAPAGAEGGPPLTRAATGYGKMLKPRSFWDRGEASFTFLFDLGKAYQDSLKAAEDDVSQAGNAAAKTVAADTATETKATVAETKPKK